MTLARRSPLEGTRLNVFLQERGIASRRKADLLIAEGHVAVNGKVVTTLGFRVPKGAQVTVDGKPVVRAVPHQTYVFYKPDLCLTSRVDPGSRRTIFDLTDLRKLPRNVQAVGRLDFRSEGLLILTNDGDLAYALTHPRFTVEKKYAVLLSDLIAPDEVELLRKGVELEDGPARPVSVRVGAKENLGAGKKGHWVEIVVTEGRNRLIRRMLDTLGHRVLRLVRTSIGDLELPLDMKPGDLRAIPPAQLSRLEQVRDEFLKGMSAEPAEDAPKRPRRTKRMNDEAYAEERIRRSLDSHARERERLQKRRQEQTAYSAETPERPARSSKPTPAERTRKPEGRATPETLKPRSSQRTRRPKDSK